MASVKAPVLGAAGGGEVALDEGVFAAAVKPHLVHEAVRAEANAARAGTKAAKSRGMVAGGRSKPWRQKGTGRARAGTLRAPQFTGGGVAFAPAPRSFAVKVNRKAYRSALRAALSDHAARGTLAIVADGAIEEPSTRAAAELVGDWSRELPIVVVAEPEQEAIVKSFRNLARVVCVSPADVEVSAIVWARSLLVTQSALDLLQRRAT